MIPFVSAQKQRGFFASESLLVVSCCGYAVLYCDLSCSWKKTGISLGYGHNPILMLSG